MSHGAVVRIKYVSWEQGGEDRGSKRAGVVCARSAGAGRVSGMGMVTRVSYWGDRAEETPLTPCVCMGMCVRVPTCVCVQFANTLLYRQLPFSPWCPSLTTHVGCKIYCLEINSKT